MKKFIIVSILFLLGISSNIFAQIIRISYDGTPVMREIHLERKDVVIIDTSIKKGTQFKVEASLQHALPKDKVTFDSNGRFFDVVVPSQVRFIDTQIADANPGWVSYAYHGYNPIDVIFCIYP